uniref:Uncharacterized protein n=1 Tax=Cucumis melo TaxID=3656 RepID=A0A9I9DBT4_CUCME
MASKEGYKSPVEQVVEGPTTRGRTARRSLSWKTMATQKKVEEHLTKLEEGLEEMQAEVNKMSGLMEELV